MLQLNKITTLVVTHYENFDMPTVHYSDPIFDELYSRIPEDSRRMSSQSFVSHKHFFTYK